MLRNFTSNSYTLETKLCMHKTALSSISAKFVHKFGKIFLQLFLFFFFFNKLAKKSAFHCHSKFLREKSGWFNLHFFDNLKPNTQAIWIKIWKILFINKYWDSFWTHIAMKPIELSQSLYPIGRVRPFRSITTLLVREKFLNSHNSSW